MTEARVRSTALGRGGARLLRMHGLMRIPIWLFRARLGFVFGSWLVLLEHIGRTSGKPRRVVLEVIGHPTPDRYLVASAFGERSQWFRNLTAQPRCRVAAGSSGLRSATARRLPTEEADAAFQAYARKHPRAWAQLGNVLETTLGAPIGDHDIPLPVIELRLDDPTPRP